MQGTSRLLQQAQTCVNSVGFSARRNSVAWEPTQTVPKSRLGGCVVEISAQGQHGGTAASENHTLHALKAQVTWQNSCSCRMETFLSSPVVLLSRLLAPAPSAAPGCLSPGPADECGTSDPNILLDALPGAVSFAGSQPQEVGFTTCSCPWPKTFLLML